MSGADVAAAVSELRRQTGVQRVCLLGFRWAHCSRILAAPGSEAVKAVMVVAPVLSAALPARVAHYTARRGEPGTVIRSDPQAPWRWRDGS